MHCGVAKGNFLLVVIIPIGLFLFPAGGMLISSYITERIFRKYMSPEDLAAEDLRCGKITDAN